MFTTRSWIAIFLLLIFSSVTYSQTGKGAGDTMHVDLSVHKGDTVKRNGNYADTTVRTKDGHQFKLGLRPRSKVPAVDTLTPKRQKAAGEIDSLKAILAAHPENDSVHHQLGNLYSDLEYWSDAAKEYEKYLEKNPRNSDVRCDYAIALTTATLDYDKGIVELRKAVEYGPENLNAIFDLAIFELSRDVQQKKKDFPEELALLSRAQDLAHKQHKDALEKKIITLVTTMKERMNKK